MTLAVKVALNPNTTNQPTNQPINSAEHEISMLDLFDKASGVTFDLWIFVKWGTH